MECLDEPFDGFLEWLDGHNIAGIVVGSLTSATAEAGRDVVNRSGDNAAVLCTRAAAAFWPRLRRLVASLNDEQIWWRPNEVSNSVGHLILHLNGNVRQWLVAPFDGVEDSRDRPAEFRAYITKLLRGEDLGFYRELDRTGRV